MSVCIDLFSGCGGLSYGFVQAGYDVVLGIDHDQAALDTFEKNHPGSKGKNLDISQPGFVEETRQILGEMGVQDIDVIIGGPPCQGFSLTGPRNFEDPRNQLYLSFLKAVEELSPKAFLIENVPGMATMYKGAIKQQIEEHCENMGYHVTSRVLCAADYGVPQMRRRVFFVGIRSDFDTRFEFPEPLHDESNYVTCEQAISDLQARDEELGSEIDVYESAPVSGYQKKMRKGMKTLWNHVATRHTDKVKNVIKQVPEGGNHKDLPPGVGEHRKFNEAWTRYHSKKPSRTIDTGHRNHFHYKWNRVPTIRENARLQSFPDTFIFQGNKTQQNRQVGNAVPPMLGFHIAKKLKETISL